MKKLLLTVMALTICSSVYAKPLFMKRYNPANNPLNQPAPAQEIDPALASIEKKYGKECIYDKNTMWKIDPETDMVSVYLGGWSSGSLTLPERKIIYGEIKIGEYVYSQGKHKEKNTQFAICRDKY